MYDIIDTRTGELYKRACSHFEAWLLCSRVWYLSYYV